MRNGQPPVADRRWNHESCCRLRIPLGQHSGRAAAFETLIKWSPGGATSAIIKGLKRAGYRSIGKGQRFIVKGSYGPLRDGELERARQWGAALAKAQ